MATWCISSEKYLVKMIFRDDFDFDIVKFPFRKAFSKFYRRHFDFVSKYNVKLKTLHLQGLSLNFMAT